MKNFKTLGVALATLFLLPLEIKSQQITGNDVTLVGAAPSAITNANARIVGNQGFGTNYYWFVAIYPIGQARVYGPLQVTGVPNVLSVSNYIQLNWNLISNATSYTVLKTSNPLLPTGTSNIAVVTGNTTGTVNDTGTALSSFTPNAVTSASGNIFINNTLYSEAREQHSIPLQIIKICFPDNTCMTTAATGSGLEIQNSVGAPMPTQPALRLNVGYGVVRNTTNNIGYTNDEIAVNPAIIPKTYIGGPIGECNNNTFGVFLNWTVPTIATTFPVIQCLGVAPHLFAQALFSNTNTQYIIKNFTIPQTWSGTSVDFYFNIGESSNGSSGNVKYLIDLACTPTGTTMAPISFTNIGDTGIISVNTSQGTGSTNKTTSVNITPTVAGCTSNTPALIKITRDNTISGNYANPMGIYSVAMFW